MPSIRDSVSILNVYNSMIGTSYSLDFVKRNNVPCPFHDDQKASARIYLDTNTLYCFSCLKHWSPVRFVQDFTHVNAEEAKKLVCSIGGIDYREPNPLSEDERIYFDVYKYCAGLFKYLCTDGYYEKRGFSKETIEKYQLGFCPTLFNVKFSETPVTLKELLMRQFPDIPEAKLDALSLYNVQGISKFAERHTFPLFDKYGRVVGFTGRASEGILPKYYNTPTIKGLFEKRDVLYNIDNALHQANVYVVEGPCDALSLINAGITNVVSPLGVALTEEHLQQLKGKQIILAFDNDRAGLNTMYKMVRSHPSSKFSVFVLQGYKDFNEALQSGANLADLVKLSKVYSAIDYIIFAHKTRFDMTDLRCRVELVKIIEELLEKGDYHWLEKDYYQKQINRLFKGKV